jgi:signal transduction histidine kinase
VATAGLALLVIAWAVVVYHVASVSYVLLDPRTKTGIEVLRAAVSLFAALVLVLLPDEPMRRPLRWVALALVLMGLGSLGFGYLYPVLVQPLSLQEGMWGSLLVQMATSTALAIGLVLPRPPRLSRRGFLAVVSATAFAGLLVLALADNLPTLTTLEALADPRVSGTGPLPGLQPAHWGLSLVPLILASTAALGVAVRYSDTRIGRWLAPAMVLFAGWQLHTLLWPSAYSSAMTTSSVLRLAFTVVVTTGVINELRNIAAERAALLAQERMYTRRLEELAVLRADFTAMVAHELASPLAGIRRSAELIDPSMLPAIQQRAIETIQSESQALAALVEDVQLSARAECDDFVVRPRPVPIAEIIAAAASCGHSNSGDHSIDVTIAASGKVLADPDRIGQVLRNLLSNAEKFSPYGTTISLRAAPIPQDKVRFEVIDRGWGIHPDDMERIFEKFGRGRSQGEGDAAPVPGVGLGLYISRRIICASGSELKASSDPGRETRFWFDLECTP